MKFIIECEMKDRWAPYFVSMLKRMEKNGQQGHSECVAFLSDGDGDFRPIFNIKSEIKIDGNKDFILKEKYVKLYDAG